MHTIKTTSLSLMLVGLLVGAGEVGILDYGYWIFNWSLDCVGLRLQQILFGQCAQESRFPHHGAFSFDLLVVVRIQLQSAHH